MDQFTTCDHKWNGNESENPLLISNFTKNVDFFFLNHLSGKKNHGQPTKHNFLAKYAEIA